MQAKIKLDDIDITILKALIKDARTNFAHIARTCNLSTTAITQRYQKLKRNGIITGTILTMHQDNKSQYFTAIDIKAESNHETSIINAIKKIPGIRSCFKTIGKYDIHASIIVESVEQLDQIKNKIRQQKGVLKIEIGMGLDRYCSHPENLSILQK